MRILPLPLFLILTTPYLALCMEPLTTNEIDYSENIERKPLHHQLSKNEIETLSCIIDKNRANWVKILNDNPYAQNGVLFFVVPNLIKEANEFDEVEKNLGSTTKTVLEKTYNPITSNTKLHNYSTICSSINALPDYQDQQTFIHTLSPFLRDNLLKQMNKFNKDLRVKRIYVYVLGFAHVENLLELRKKL